MPIINFTLTKQLEKRVNEAIKQHGFSSKAEFFRMAAMNYLDEVDDISQEELQKSITELKEALVKKFKGKKLPSLEEQMRNF